MSIERTYVTVQFLEEIVLKRPIPLGDIMAFNDNESGVYRMASYFHLH